jgi:hypothetical protein
VADLTNQWFQPTSRGKIAKTPVGSKPQSPKEVVSPVKTVDKEKDASIKRRNTMMQKMESNLK